MDQSLVSEYLVLLSLFAQDVVAGFPPLTGRAQIRDGPVLFKSPISVGPDVLKVDNKFGFEC